MPVTKAALKKQRQDKKRTQENNQIRRKLTTAVKSVRKKSSAPGVNAGYSAADKAVKKGLIHKNKAARIKSQLARLAPKPSATASKPKTSTKKAK